MKTPSFVTSANESGQRVSFPDRIGSSLTSHVTPPSWVTASHVRACQELIACTADRRVVRCARGSGHPASETCGLVAGVDGAIAPGVGGPGSPSDWLRRYHLGGPRDRDRGVDHSAGPA